MMGKKRSLFLGMMLLVMLLWAVPAMAVNRYTVSDNSHMNVKGKTLYSPIIKIQDARWNDIVYYNGEIKKNSLNYDKKLLKVEDTGYFLRITPKKPGLSKVVFKTIEDGKTKKYSFRVKSYKLKAGPIKSLKFGKGESFNDKDFIFVDQYSLGTPNLYTNGKYSAKFVIKVRSGWKVKSAVSVTTVNGKWKQKKLNLKKKISVKSDSRIIITMVDKKGNELPYEMFGMVIN